MDLYGHEQYTVSLIIFQIFSSSSIQVFVHIDKTWSYANANTHAKANSNKELSQTF